MNVGRLKNMPRRKRLRSVCHSIAHHAVSGLSYVHPHVLRACRDANINSLQVDLLGVDPCPQQFIRNEPLRLSLRGLREKFESILAAEGFTISDLTIAKLSFSADLGRDDYCSVCQATLKSKDQEPVEYIVNYLGQVLDAQPGSQQDAAR